MPFVPARPLYLPAVTGTCALRNRRACSTTSSMCAGVHRQEATDQGFVHCGACPTSTSPFRITGMTARQAAPNASVQRVRTLRSSDGYTSHLRNGSISAMYTGVRRPTLRTYTPK